MKYQVFIKGDSLHCSEIVEFMKKAGVDTQIVDVSEKEGFLLSQKQHIMKLPTVVLLDSKNNALDRLYTLSEIQKIIESSD